MSNSDILTAPLWHNKSMLIGDKPACIKPWLQHGISTVKDIIDKNGKFLSKEQMENKYAFNIKHMDYNCLMHAIPQKWKKQLKGKPVVLNTGPTDFMIKLNGKTKHISKAQCKDYYWEFVITLHKCQKLRKNGQSTLVLMSLNGQIYISCHTLSPEIPPHNPFSIKLSIVFSPAITHCLSGLVMRASTANSVERPTTSNITSATVNI